jgi:hypothetical protein
MVRSFDLANDQRPTSADRRGMESSEEPPPRGSCAAKPSRLVAATQRAVF